MEKFNVEAFFRREIELAKNLLAINPNDQKQRDRLAHSALKLGDLETAIKYGTSEKLKQLIACQQKTK